MSDSKKPKLSEVRARCPTTAGYIYLLDLVERMGKVLGEMEKDYPADPECWPVAKKARALLKELEL